MNDMTYEARALNSIRLLCFASVLAMAACSKSDSSAGGSASPSVKDKGGELASSAQKTAAPASASVAFAAAEPKLAAGEQLATTAANEPSRVTWSVSGGTITLAAVTLPGSKVVVRSFSSAGTADVGAPIAAGDTSHDLTISKDGKSVVFRASSLAARSQQAGALMAYHLMRIVWRGGSAVVESQFDCDESTAPKETCTEPAWARE